MKRLILCLVASAAVLHGQEADKPKRMVIVVSHDEYPLAKMKAELADLLVQSLRDEGIGIVDAKHEQRIRKLMVAIQKWVPPAKPLEDMAVIHLN